MNEFYLSRKDILALYHIMEDFQDIGNLKLTVDSSSGIGTEITASFSQTINNFDGQFVITITDESDW
jgi:hypothetical protein